MPVTHKMARTARRVAFSFPDPELLLALAVFAFTLLASRAPSAYPWMIRHDDAACAMCHADPSGARAYDEAALRKALDALAAAKKDSDGVGVADTDELRHDALAAAIRIGAGSEYGCRLAPGAVERRAPSLGVGGLVAAALLALRRCGRAGNLGPVALRASRAKEQAI